MIETISSKDVLTIKTILKNFYLCFFSEYSLEIDENKQQKMNNKREKRKELEEKVESVVKLMEQFIYYSDRDNCMIPWKEYLRSSLVITV